MINKYTYNKGKLTHKTPTVKGTKRRIKMKSNLWVYQCRLMQIQLRIIKIQPLMLFLSLSTQKNIGDGLGAKKSQTMTLEMKQT